MHAPIGDPYTNQYNHFIPLSFKNLSDWEDERTLFDAKENLHSESTFDEKDHCEESVWPDDSEPFDVNKLSTFDDSCDSKLLDDETFNNESLYEGSFDVLLGDPPSETSTYYSTYNPHEIPIRLSDSQIDNSNIIPSSPIIPSPTNPLPTPQPAVDKPKKISLESRLNQSFYSCLNIMRAALTALTAFALAYGTCFFTALSITLALKVGILLSIVPGLFAAGLAYSAIKCASIAKKYFFKGITDIVANSYGAFRK